jgi:hypothetical protein
VHITARDALQREATVTLPLLVLPFTEWPIAADAPGAVTVGRNLYVTKYRVTLSTAAHASSGLDSDTLDILEQVKEDLMGDVAELLFEVGASQDPRAREEARGLLTALLGEYRQIDEWTSTEVAVTVAAKVWIDGELVKEIRPEPPFARRKSSAAHPLVVAKARKRWRSKPSAAYWPARSRSNALRWGFRYLGSAKETREAMRKEFPRWAEALDVMISEAEQLAIDLRRRLEERWHPLPLDEISLTPGPHRVKVEVSTWTVVIDPGLAPPAVSASATVTIRPLNREIWPRLNHEGVVQVVLGGGGTSSAERIVDCGESGVDVVYASGQKLWVIAATGKANEPYSAPKAFDGQIDFEPTLLASGQQDDIGRSGLLVGSRQKAVAFVNGGPGGYDKVALDSTGPWEALAFSPVRADGWARLLLLREDALWVGSGLAGPLAWSKNALAPPLFGDAAVRMVAFVDGAGRVVVGLAYFLSGLTRFHLLAADGTLGAPVAGPAWGSQDHRRQISALRVGAMEPGGADLLSALRQGRQARWSRMTSNGWTAPASAELPLPVRALAPGPGTAAGALLLLEPDDAAVLLWSAGGVLSMLPIDLAAGAREVDSCERVAAVSSRDADVVRVLMAPETLE